MFLVNRDQRMLKIQCMENYASERTRNDTKVVKDTRNILVIRHYPVLKGQKIQTYITPTDRRLYKAVQF